MLFAHAHGLLWLLLVSICFCAIDRIQVVNQYNLRGVDQNVKVPLQVGNGNFAFNVDITGTQSIRPYKSLSTWGWHKSSPPGAAQQAEEAGIEMPGQQHVARLMNLARIGFLWNGTAMRESMLDGAQQMLNLGTGVITSTFNIGNDAVDVETLASPSLDAVGIRVQSEGLKHGNLTVYIDFPYPSYENDTLQNPTVNYGGSDAERTSFKAWGPRVEVKHEIDDTRYFTNIQWDSGSPTAKVRKLSPHSHRYIFDVEDASAAEFVFHFTSGTPAFTPGFAIVKKESTYWWQQFWKRGAFFDCTGTKDPRAEELQRLAVLSQYRLAVNMAGSRFLADSGLTNNAEDVEDSGNLAWSHVAHWQRWSRWDRVGSLLPMVYGTNSSSTRSEHYGADPAKRQPSDNKSPWQLPDPFYLAEQEYQAVPSRTTLTKWHDVLIRKTQEMLDTVQSNKTSGRYSIVRPSNDSMVFENDVFDLAYWRFGLDIMSKWFERQNLTVPSSVKSMYNGLVQFPIDASTGTYKSSSSPRKPSSMTAGIFGMLPPDPQLDITVFQRTMDALFRDYTRGEHAVDIPVLAMTAVRSGNSSRAVDLLLDKSLNFDKSGLPLARGGHQAQFSTSGALLMAVAMLADGWANSSGPHWPLGWTCVAEGFSPGL